MRRLENKAALITGAGAGIGAAIARRFAEEGARLLLNDLRPEGAAEIAASLAPLTSVEVLAGNIADESTALALAERAQNAFGGLDILVNNAADFTQKSVESAEIADWRRVLDVNVVGTALVAKHAIPLLKQRRGAIVNMASMSALIAQPDFATYNASKGAILTLTRCMALDLAPAGVRVNAVCPGCIFTSASEREIARLGLTFEEWRDRVAPKHMLNRLGDPREVANAVLFLASDEASFITGEHLLVDGGYVQW